MTDGYALPGAPPSGAPTNGATPNGMPDGYQQGGTYGGPGDDQGQKRPREDDPNDPNKRLASGPPSGMAVGPETVYRLLCDQSIIGGMIGRGGEKVNAVQRNTGAFVQAIQDAPPHCLERVIVISGPKDVAPGEYYNPAQKALFELFDTQLQLDRSAGGPVLRYGWNRVRWPAASSTMCSTCNV
jgi:KH domain